MPLFGVSVHPAIPRVPANRLISEALGSMTIVPTDPPKAGSFSRYCLLCPIAAIGLAMLSVAFALMPMPMFAG